VLGAVAPHTVTLVVLMGVRRRAAIALDLLERGWSPDTPAALIRSASTPDAETRIGTLGRWAREAPPPGDGPGTLVVGEVVRVAERAAAATASLLAAVEKGVPA
jgi:siroheme synthase